MPALVGHRHAECGQHAGVDRNHRTPDAECFSEGADVQAAGAAEADQEKIRRVVSAIYRNTADGFDHVFVGDADDAPGGGFDLKADTFREIANGVPGPAEIEFEPAGEWRARRQPAEQQVGVGDRRLRSALAIASRARVRACRFRPDLEHAAAVDPGDRAAAGANRVHVDHGHGNRIFAEAAFAGNADRPFEQGDIGGGAAHVEADEPSLAELAAEIFHRGEASRRAGKQQFDGGIRRLAGADRLAARLHDLQRRTGGQMAEAALQALQITAHHGTEKGVEPGGHAPLVFPVLRQYLRRAGKEKIGKSFPQRRLDGFFVARVEKGKQQIDRHRFRAEFADLFDEGGKVFSVQRIDGGAVGGDAPAGFQAERRWRRRRRRLEFKRVKLRPGLSREGEQVAESPVGDKNRAGAFALQQGIGRHRAAMDELQRRAGKAEIRKSPEHRPLRRLGSGRNLVNRQLDATAREWTNTEKISESATDVDADSQGGICYGHGAAL